MQPGNYNMVHEYCTLVFSVRISFVHMLIEEKISVKYFVIWNKLTKIVYK